MSKSKKKKESNKKQNKVVDPVNAVPTLEECKIDEKRHFSIDILNLLVLFLYILSLFLGDYINQHTTDKFRPIYEVLSFIISPGLVLIFSGTTIALHKNKSRFFHFLNVLILVFIVFLFNSIYYLVTSTTDTYRPSLWTIWFFELDLSKLFFASSVPLIHLIVYAFYYLLYPLFKWVLQFFKWWWYVALIVILLILQFVFASSPVFVEINNYMYVPYTFLIVNLVMNHKESLLTKKKTLFGIFSFIIVLTLMLNLIASWMGKSNVLMASGFYQTLFRKNSLLMTIFMITISFMAYNIEKTYSKIDKYVTPVVTRVSLAGFASIFFYPLSKYLYEDTIQATEYLSNNLLDIFWILFKSGLMFLLIYIVGSALFYFLMYPIKTLEVKYFNKIEEKLYKINLLLEPKPKKSK